MFSKFSEKLSIESLSVFKVFRQNEHSGSIVGYNLVNKLYHIIYDDYDTEEYYHNEVRDQQKQIIFKRKQQK